VLGRIRASARGCENLRFALPSGGLSPAQGGSVIAAVIPFPQRQRVANCLDCGSHFRQRALHHLRCSTCYWWRRGLIGLALADRAFRALRAGGYR
jgi:hypothetical protein